MMPSHKASRSGFTLIEMLISIVIFTVMVLFLYQTLDTLRSANNFYGEKVDALAHEQKVLKTLYLDIALSRPKSLRILNDDREHDVLLMQTSNSVHHRIMPYVGYILKEGMLYRIESLQPLTYPFEHDIHADVDVLMKLNAFRIYSSNAGGITRYLVHLRPGKENRLLKVRAFNQ